MSAKLITKGDKTLHVPVVDNVPQTCDVPKQQPCKDRHERMGQDRDHFNWLVFPPTALRT